MATAPLYLIGPFHRILTMQGLPSKGPIPDSGLNVVSEGGVVVQEGRIHEIGEFDDLYNRYKRKRASPAEGHEQGARSPAVSVREIPVSQRPLVLLPGFLDAHTHICFAGSRAADYVKRISGASYLELLEQGGGIHETVRATSSASSETLASLLTDRLRRHLNEGITTVEVKTGYGLLPDEELRQLDVILNVAKPIGPGRHMLPDVIPTCLAAHAAPPGMTAEQTLEGLARELLPELSRRKGCGRVDIYIEEGAFDPESARGYLMRASAYGFDLAVHAGQFTDSGVPVAVQCGARSVDHLEAIGQASINLLARSSTVAVVLPGASMGLGAPFAPGRALLDAGASLAIATDWNPGSAPMGDLLMQAAVFGAAQRLSMAETFAAITARAASALALSDRGSLEPRGLADMIAFNTDHEREILYGQGRLKPSHVWKSGVRLP